MEIPRDIKYSEAHIWLKIQHSEALIGITELVKGKMGKIEYVNLPSPRSLFEREEIFASLEAQKSIADLLMPVSGEVIEVNNNVLTQVDLVNDTPYDEGWMIKIKLTDLSELDDLMDAEAYKKSLE